MVFNFTIYEGRKSEKYLNVLEKNYFHDFYFVSKTRAVCLNSSVATQRCHRNISHTHTHAPHGITASTGV